MFVTNGEIYTHCSECNLKYEREVGFWYGAMYVSYALGIAIFVGLWIATNLLLPLFFKDGFSIFVQIGLVITGIVLLAPFNWFLSRLIWINLFVKYEGKGESEFHEKTTS